MYARVQACQLKPTVDFGLFQSWSITFRIRSTGIDKPPSLIVEMAKTSPSVQVFSFGILAELSGSIYIAF